MLFARLREAYMNFTLSIKKIIYSLLLPVSQWAEPMLKRKFLHINPETTNIQSVKVIISNENKRVSCYHGSPNGRGGYQISINKSINTVNEQCMTIWSREGWGWYPDDVTLSDTGNSYKSGVQLPFGQIQIKSALPFGERGDEVYLSKEETGKLYYGVIRLNPIIYDYFWFFWKMPVLLRKWACQNTSLQIEKSLSTPSRHPLNAYKQLNNQICE